MTDKLIVARHQESRVPVLILTGQIPKDGVRQGSLYSFNPIIGSEHYSSVSFSIGRKGCNAMVENLRGPLAEKGYTLEYRGDVVVPVGSLAQVTMRSELYALVYQTLHDEAEGKLNPDDLEEFDYQAKLDGLETVLTE